MTQSIEQDAENIAHNFIVEEVLREILIKKIGETSKEFYRPEDVPHSLRQLPTPVLAKVLASYQRLTDPSGQLVG